MDVAGAQIAYMIATSAGAKDHKVSDYLPRWAPVPRVVAPMDVEAMVASLKGLASRQRQQRQRR